MKGQDDESRNIKSKQFWWCDNMENFSHEKKKFEMINTWLGMWKKKHLKKKSFGEFEF